MSLLRPLLDALRHMQRMTVAESNIEEPMLHNTDGALAKIKKIRSNQLKSKFCFFSGKLSAHSSRPSEAFWKNSPILFFIGKIITKNDILTENNRRIAVCHNTMVERTDSKLKKNPKVSTKQR